MKLLVFGQTGQVARELIRSASEDMHVTSLGRDLADLSDPTACAKIIMHTDADVIINAAANTAVDEAEDNEQTAKLINGEAPTAMARAAAERRLPFLHISTDYVFDGSSTQPWTASDTPNPIGVYGRSKLHGEIGVAEAGGPYAILRTSWVYSAHGTNFVKTMLRLGKQCSALSVVNDQVGGPTSAADIAATLLKIASAFIAGKGTSGIFHYAGAPEVSWETFAREIFAQAGLAVDVTGILSSDYPTPAARPLNSRLDCSTLEQAFGIARPDWHQGLKHVLQDLGEI